MPACFDIHRLIFCRLQEIFGGNAVSDEYHIGRHVANLFVTQTYEVSPTHHSSLDRSMLIVCRARAIYIA